MSNWLEQIKQQFSGVLVRAENEIRELAGPVFPAGRGSAPSTVDVLLIDTSWSMDETDYPPSRLEAAVAAGTQFLRKLDEVNPRAWVGIVAYAGTPRLVMPPMGVREHRHQMEEAMKDLSLGNSTNIGDALTLGDRELRRIAAGGRKRLLLLTDGHSNCGRSPEAVAAALKQRGVQLDIIGIAGSRSEVNEPMLERMASVIQEQKRYWFIESVGELVQRFEALALREVK